MLEGWSENTWIIAGNEDKLGLDLEPVNSTEMFSRTTCFLLENYLVKGSMLKHNKEHTTLI